MPSYEYECQVCGARMTVRQRIGDAPHTEHECGSCGAVAPVKRVFAITKILGRKPCCEPSGGG